MDYTELFDRYIDGQLEGKELEDFERKLEIDPDLKDELEKFRKLNAVAERSIGRDESTEGEAEVDSETEVLSKEDISEFGKGKRASTDNDLSDFQQVLKDAEKGYLMEGKTPFNRIRLMWYTSAAVLIIALSTATYFFIRNSQQRTADLYAAFFEPYIKSDKVFELTRSSDDFYYAVQVFEAGDFSRATVLFSNLSDSSELRVYALFYAGLTSIELGRWEDAINSFKQAIGCGENQMSYVSRWYLGLCYLRIDDEESAKKQFEVLSSEKNPYSRKARQILRILDRR
jgi:tetratricopeptide (TPR) repeat protein